MVEKKQMIKELIKLFKEVEIEADIYEDEGEWTEVLKFLMENNKRLLLEVVRGMLVETMEFLYEDNKRFKITMKEALQKDIAIDEIYMFIKEVKELYLKRGYGKNEIFFVLCIDNGVWEGEIEYWLICGTKHTSRKIELGTIEIIEKYYYSKKLNERIRKLRKKIEDYKLAHSL